MDRQKIVAFTRRIASGNRSQIIEILFEIYFAYADDGTVALEKKDYETAMDALRHCNQVLQHLKADLDFKYDISRQLYPLYDFCQRQVAKAMYTGRADALQDAAKVMEPLREAFSQVASVDDTGALMQNAQQITAGYTYGKTDITEVTEHMDTSRGFLA